MARADVHLGQMAHRRSAAQVGLVDGRRRVVGARQPRRLLARRADAEPAHHRVGDEPRQLGGPLDRALERLLEHRSAAAGAQHGDADASQAVVPRRGAADQAVDLMPRQHGLGASTPLLQVAGVNDDDADAGQQPDALHDDLADAFGERAIARRDHFERLDDERAQRRRRGRRRGRRPPAGGSATRQPPRRARRQSAAAATASSATRGPPDGRPCRSTTACPIPAAPRRCRPRSPPASPAASGRSRGRARG